MTAHRHCIVSLDQVIFGPGGFHVCSKHRPHCRRVLLNNAGDCCSTNSTLKFHDFWSLFPANWSFSQKFTLPVVLFTIFSGSNMPWYFSAPPFHHLFHSRCVSTQQRWGRARSRREIWLGHTVSVLKMNEWAAVSVCTAIMQQTFNQPKTAPAHRLPVQLWSGLDDSLLSISQARQTSSCIFIPPLCPYKYEE